MSASVGYQVVVDNNALAQLGVYLDDRIGQKKVFILTDENTNRYCLPVLKSHLPGLAGAIVVVMPAGEDHKSLSVLESLAMQLLQHGADRSSLLINLGGGVVGDVGGLLASLFMRGIPFVQVPTSLMAMVDASVGGKTGVNLHNHKNMLGLFSKPDAVFIDPVFLSTLPLDELRSGFAEVIKHACIANVPAFEELPASGEISLTDWLPLIASAVAFKSDVVEADFKDLHQRKVLNFGHTVGHALESYSMVHGDQRLLHGEAVALGMQVELVLSTQYVGLPITDAHKWIRFIRSHFPDLSLLINDDLFLPFLMSDKKKSDGQLLCVLLGEQGKPMIDIPVHQEHVLEALSSVLTNYADLAV